MLAKLVRRGWLLRGIEVTLSDGRHLVEYDGRGAGYEQVSVDGGVIRMTSWIWFAPRFEFKLGGRRTIVEVQVWPWLTLRSLAFQIDDEVVYAEGVAARRMKPISELSEWRDLA
jgi:hypothetical protein